MMILDKKVWKKVCSSKKSTTFASAIRLMESFHKTGQYRMQSIGVWCNGNTTDSGPVILGSSPSTPTMKEAK